MVDSTFAFELPSVTAAWIETMDVETGQAQMLSRGAARELAGHVREFQDKVAHAAREEGMDVIRIGADHDQADLALSEFVGERRLRKG